jgi:hypothetical protein
LRPEGGFPTTSSPECQGEACQGPPQSPPAEPGVGSEPRGPRGNVKESPPTRRCPKGKHKARRHGKVRCVRNKKHGKHDNRANQKRTSSKQGVEK